MSISAITVDEGIEGYRPEALKKARYLAEDLTWNTTSLNSKM